MPLKIYKDSELKHDEQGRQLIPTSFIHLAKTPARMKRVLLDNDLNKQRPEVLVKGCLHCDHPFIQRNTALKQYHCEACGSSEFYDNEGKSTWETIAVFVYKPEADND